MGVYTNINFVNGNDPEFQKAVANKNGELQEWEDYHGSISVRPDSFAGWQSEVWTIWWPIWRQIGFTNTHFTREAAEQMCRLHADFRNL